MVTKSRMLATNINRIDPFIQQRIAQNKASVYAPSIRPMDHRYYFDTRELGTFSAAGVLAVGAVEFFGSPFGDHPLGAGYTNMKIGGKISNNKIFQVEEIGVDVMFVSGNSLTPDDTLLFGSLLGQTSFFNLYKSDENDRKFVLGTIGHYPGYGNFGGLCASGLIDNPAAVAAYLAKSPTFSLGLPGGSVQQRRRLRVPWVLNPDANFALGIEWQQPITMTATFTGSKLKAIISLYGTETTSVK